MPDITMCKDKRCPQRKKCYRFMAKPSEYWQAYFTGSPRQGKDCLYFDLIEGDTNEQDSDKNTV